jgi:hypothetical protein
MLMTVLRKLVSLLFLPLLDYEPGQEIKSLKAHLVENAPDETPVDSFLGRG